MSSTRLTLGAVLGTVQTTANTLTGTLEAVNAGVGMLNTFVTGAAENQRIRAIADKEVFVESLIKEKAMEESLADLKIKKYMSQSQDHAETFSSNYSKFQSLLRNKSTDEPNPT